MCVHKFTVYCILYIPICHPLLNEGKWFAIFGKGRHTYMYMLECKGNRIPSSQLDHTECGTFSLNIGQHSNAFI